MHWEILDNKRINMLQKIAEQVDIGEYYMAGGTALSLQMGLRKSVDFDFFVPHDFNSDDLYSQLCEISPDSIAAVNINSRGTCDVVMDSVQVSFFKYPYETLYEYVNDTSAPKLNLAAVADIATMKAIAIGSRGAKKDFFDLYEIFEKTTYTTKQLVEDLYKKYGENRNLSYIGMGLNYFEEAEQELLPETFVKYDWEAIKTSFGGIQNEFFREIESIEQKRDMENEHDDFEL